MNRHDHRLRAFPQPPPIVRRALHTPDIVLGVDAVRDRIVIEDLCDVVARREATSGAADQNCVHLIIGFGALHLIEQILDDRPRPRIELLRAVEDDRKHAFRHRSVDEARGHASFLSAG